ncbi:MAG: sensor histidine kinase [Candidatus Saccharimonadales bacterium]
MGWFTKKKTQGAGNNQRQMSELALLAVHDGVMILDATGNIAFINPAACNLLGYTHDEAFGLSHLSVVHLVDKQGNAMDQAANPITIALNTNQYTETREYSIVVNMTNKIIPVSLIITPTGEIGDPKIVNLRDITKELKEEEERNEFISTASHEMRTPVASIEGYLGLAMNPQTATVDARAAGYLAKAHEASRHLGHLFQDLLDTTKLDDGKMKLRMQPVEMTALVKSIAEGQIPSINAKGLKFQFGNGPQVQSTGGKRISQLIYAQVDVDYLREVIDNIIENAIKYTKAGSVSVSVSGDEANVRIAISDSGIGVPRDELNHIFQKFYRVDNSDTREIGGTGLGLHITKQRVELMGGRIWAESQVGKGTTFYVSFPRLTTDEYEKRRLAFTSLLGNTAIAEQSPIPAPAQTIAPAPTPAPAPQQPAPEPQPTPAPAPAPQPIAQPIPAPAPQAQPVAIPQTQPIAVPQAQPITAPAAAPMLPQTPIQAPAPAPAQTIIPPTPPQGQ